MWIFASLAVGLILFALLRTLAATVIATDDQDHAILFYDMQLAEISRQQEAGFMDQLHGDAARTEAARALIATKSGISAISLAGPATNWHVRLAAILLLVGVPLIALPVYALLGSPNLADAPLALRSHPKPAEASMQEIISRIETQLAKAPDDVRGLELIAPLYLKTGRPEDSVRAIKELIRLTGSSAYREVDLGEAIMATQGGVITQASKAAFEKAFTLDPTLPKARYYMGHVALQDGNPAKAKEIWQTLVVDMPVGPMRQAIENEIREIDIKTPVLQPGMKP